MLLAMAAAMFAACDDTEVTDVNYCTSYYVANDSGQDLTLLTVKKDVAGVVMTDQVWEIPDGKKRYLFFEAVLNDSSLYPRAAPGHGDVMVVFADSATLRYTAVPATLQALDSHNILNPTHWSITARTTNEWNEPQRDATFTLTTHDHTLAQTHK